MTRLKNLEMELQGHGVGMDEPLIDRQGFPRSDLDVASVRTLRHQIICLRNDHKNVMSEIEKVLHHIHQAQPPNNTETLSTPARPTSPASVPFAKVNAVAPDSPASMAGLQRNDLIVQFGTIRHDHMQPLSSLATTVQSHLGQPLPVVVSRNSQLVQLSLIPSTAWGGRGALGCHIVPL
ncbi:putative 26S proteasome non-ATPase regulatory subunit [Hesseltinella vesiculosa]|uniref:Probable 26S proteasome regulatory subunit p27 n=1 Tax=Hesseltinella vesiculosa TaxID=101127 RepID=A0A1X2GTZ1_9FUNG|nr:putative 26S proteasome non-ATPase regulatory subunit [Hesseltinella vesiculosa]